MTAVRLLVADDQELIRLALRTLAASETDLDLVGEATNGREALELTRRLRPDVLLLDIRMPLSSGLDVLRETASDSSLRDVKVVMMTTFDVEEYIFEALETGASGFVTKDADPEQILQAVRAAAAGDALLSPSVTRTVLRRFAGRRREAAPHPQLDRLTAREREMVGWTATGMSNDEIARRLTVSPATVRTHVGRAMAKLGARDRAQLVVFAYRSGLPIPE